jgi:homoserine O-succinyltransferase
MPVCLHRDSAGHDLNGRKPALGFRSTSARCLDIGLIVNMPDTALKSTERQFLSLLESAAAGLLIRLSFYALPDVPRSEPGHRHVKSFYSPLQNLWDRQLDGLIVTGTEPRAANLREEPYWESLTQVLDWADEHTHSAVWSCLAAHAAVLHLDGIGRRPLEKKRFGLFRCAPVSRQGLTAALPPRLLMPHSRWNDLPEKELKNSGYRVLTTSRDAGADTFFKQRNSLFVFFQGHPEYEANTLMLEYRRDIGRYLRGERETYPLLPRDYFDDETTAALQDLEARAASDRREELLADFPSAMAEERLRSPWRGSAARMYHNWLTYLSAQKELRLQNQHARKAAAQAVAFAETRRVAAGD